MSKLRPWKSQKKGYQESLSYLQGRMLGEITSFRTPWLKFNDATTDGLEWHSMTVIAGRPGSGKTLIQDQIIREGFELNKNQKFRVLKLEFEMLAKTSAIREYSSYLGKTYKSLCSADGSTLSRFELDQCHSYAKTMCGYPVDIIDEAITVSELKQIVINYMEDHSELVLADDGVNYIRVYTNTVITLDHSLLMRRDSFEKEKMDMLYNLGEAITFLKRRYPIAWIILSQLSRAIEAPERNEDGKYGNYVLESDIFGADALLQHADTVVGLNRPGKYKIGKYGPERYIIKDENILVMHFLKARNGNTGLAFFKSEYEKMTVSEIPSPPKDQKYSRNKE